MNLDQLEVLQTILNEGSFRAASERLHRAQSAISYAISQLEDFLGFEIFDRSTYRPKLTKKGKLFYEKSLKLLEEASELKKFSQSISQEAELNLNLFVTHIFDSEKLICAIQDLIKLYPSTQINLKQGIFGDVNLVHSGQIDIMLDDIKIFDDNLEIKKIKPARMHMVISSHHSIFNVKSSSRKKKLLEYPQIVVERNQSDQNLRKGVIKGARTWSVTDFDTKKKMIVEGLGWGHLPEFLIHQELKNKKLKIFKELDSPTVEIPLYLIRKKTAYHGLVSQYLWKIIK